MIKRHVIKDVHAREIADSRKNPAIEVEVWLGKSYGNASIPSGISKGKYEALELRDGGPLHNGLGVSKAVFNVNALIRKAIIGKSFRQKELDNFLISLDGTKNKQRLGANAILGVSLAFAHAAANTERMPLYLYFKEISGTTGNLSLPIPMFNILEGGRHASNSLSIQEFMVLPMGARSFKEAINFGLKIFHTLGSLLSSKNLGTEFGDEGGYAPTLDSNETAMELIAEAIKECGFKHKEDIAISIDAAASEFYKNGRYSLEKDKKSLQRAELMKVYGSWAKNYNLFSIEDPFHEEDFEGHSIITKRIGRKTLIVGDDLFATSLQRLREGISKRAANAIIIKLNQIGTISEAIEVVKFAKKKKYVCIVSHRSGETYDSSIADFAVGLKAEYIKAGAFHQAERISKYTRLIKIEESLGKKAKYAISKRRSR